MKPEELKLINQRREWLGVPAATAEDFGNDDLTACACGLFVAFDATEEWTDSLAIIHSRDRCYA
jgi:hypothetical protein